MSITHERLTWDALKPLITRVPALAARDWYSAGYRYVKLIYEYRD